MFDRLYSSVNLMERTLDASWLRNEVIANNLANADTAGFKASTVEFESLLKSAMEEPSFEAKKTREKHRDFNVSVDGVQSQVVQDTSTTMKMDGNNVDSDKENVELLKNAIYYNTLLTKVSKELGRLKLAITESR